MKSRTMLAAATALALAACGDRDPTRVYQASESGELSPTGGRNYEGNSANLGFILFSTDRDNPSTAPICAGCEEIYSMLPDGSEPLRLTSNSSNDGGPAWSQEGKRIAFHTNRSGHAQIFLMGVDGTDQRLLVDLGVNDAGAQRGAVFPSWSPSGDRLCFGSVSRPREIFVTGVDGTAPTNITNHPGDDLRCDWSPEGDRIAFGSTRAGGDEEVYVMNADGSDPVRLTLTPRPDANPDWSPQGDRIVFESSRDGTAEIPNAEIYVMNADGSEQTRLTNNPGQDTKPSWSPRGDRIAFHRRIAGHLEVFTMNPDGTDVTRVTDTADPGFSGFPSWAKGKRDH